MASKRATEVQLKVFRKMVEVYPVPFVRIRGGFWCPKGTSGERTVYGFVPTWWCGTQTIRAMAERGWIVSLKHPADSWRFHWTGEYVITDAGREQLPKVIGEAEGVV